MLDIDSFGVSVLPTLRKVIDEAVTFDGCWRERAFLTLIPLFHMNHLYSRASWVLYLPLLLSPARAAFSQTPTITSVVPQANARAALRTAPLTVTFSHSLTAASAGALQVFSNQRGGRRTGPTPAVVSGNTLSFAPSLYAFMPGETVQYTVTTAASNGAALARPRVGQFTTAVGGTGTGTFVTGSELVTTSDTRTAAMGDVDGDGDLDLLVANNGRFGGAGTVSVLLNNGAGTYASGQTVTVGLSASALVLGDVDGDGDLDLLLSNNANNTVSVRLNDGSGAFSGTQELTVDGAPVGMALGDLDGDGDLDLIVSNYGLYWVSVRFNNGAGLFSGNQNVPVESDPQGVALDDVDGDGDLDLLAANSAVSTVSVRLNNGSGSFGGTQNVSVGAAPLAVALGDLDGDGDVDLLSVNRNVRTVSVRFNNGGTFSGTQDLAVGNSPLSLAMGDVDGDGDLDVVTGNSFTPGSLSVRLNNGSGLFSGTQDVSVGINPRIVLLGDTDSDGDLDLVSASSNGGTLSVRLNGSTALSTSLPRNALGLEIFPVPAQEAVTLTGGTANTPVSVLDALGRMLCSTSTDANGTATLFLPHGTPTGVYLVRNSGQVLRLIVE